MLLVPPPLLAVLAPPTALLRPSPLPLAMLRSSAYDVDFPATEMACPICEHPNAAHPDWHAEVEAAGHVTRSTASTPAAALSTTPPRPTSKKRDRGEERRRREARAGMPVAAVPVLTRSPDLSPSQIHAAARASRTAAKASERLLPAPARTEARRLRRLRRLAARGTASPSASAHSTPPAVLSSKPSPMERALLAL